MKLKIFSTLLTAILILGACAETANDVENNSEEAVDEVEQAIEEVEMELDNAEQEMEGIVQQIEQNINNAEQSVDEQIVSEGEIAQLKTNSIVALTEESYDELYGLMDVDNVNEIVQLYETDKVMLVEDTTKLEIVDIDLTEVKVNIVGTDQTGYVHLGLLTESL